MTIDWGRRSRFAGPWQSPGFLLWQVTHEWQRQINRSLEDLELTQMQFVLLAGIGWLAREGERVSQQALADFCRIGRMQVSQVARLLERKRLVTRARDPGDARALVLALTKSGEQRLAAGLERVESEDAAFFAKRSRPESLRALLSLLRA